jgi:hypothetical protein
LEQDALLALWQEGVPLGNAWLVFTDERNTTRFFELQRTNSHLELQRLLKAELMGRLRDGKRRALGVQEGSDPRLVVIPQYYFSKNAEVDWEKDKITAAGKVFHEVIVRWEREPPDEGQPPKPTRWIHPGELEALLERGPPREPEPFPGEHWEWEPLDETPPSEPSELTVQNAGDAPRSEPQPAKGQTPLINPAADTEPADKSKARKRIGRPPLVPKLQKLVRELINQGKFEGKSKKDITALVGEKARERFKSDFYGPNLPSKPTIYAAIVAEGWQSTDEN